MKPVVWTLEMDSTLESMWAHFPTREIADALGVSPSVIEYRGEKLKLPLRVRAVRFEPPEDAWVDAATFFARQADVLPQMVLSGHKTPAAVIARRKAIAYILRTYPRVTYGGLARVSGFDHDTISLAAKKMRAPDPDGIRSIGEVIEQHLHEIVGVDA